MSLLAIAAVAAQTAADAHNGATGGLPQFDPSSWPSQLFWLAIFFGGLYWLMSSVFIPRIGATIEERRDRIADDLDQAGDYKQQASAAEAAYVAALEGARAKARALAADTQNALGAELAELQREADAKAAASVEAAEKRIASMKTTAAAKVREAAAETTRAIVETLIDETPAPDAVSGAIGRVSQAAGASR
jgi:F-type H+-transporting ATPase subunit b